MFFQKYIRGLHIQQETKTTLLTLYWRSVFGATQEDIAKDKFFRGRNSKLVFITPAHLDINDKFWNTDLWDAAVSGMKYRKEGAKEHTNCNV